MGRLGKWLRSVVPGSCVLCAAAANVQGLCDGCSASLPAATGSRCPVCASQTPNASLCGRCIRRPPRYDYVVSALEYVTPVDFLVAELKYSRNLAAARALASPLASRLANEPCPDIVLPMPIADSRLRERGFNQSMEIGRALARTSGLRLDPGLCRRTRDTPAQVDLSPAQRARNVRGAFRCTRALAGITIAVIDDVMTTGATLEEIAGVLKKAGASRVVNWVAARTLPPPNQ